MTPPLTNLPPDTPANAFVTTREAAQALGLAVRSVQLMVDRGELQAWRTTGGHRRIVRRSVDAWLTRGTPNATAVAATPMRVLLIEDSVHFQGLVRDLLARTLPQIALRVVGDGIIGLATVGEWRPDVLVVDILLPGIDGAALIARLRADEHYRRMHVVVLTGLSQAELLPHAHALAGIPVVHKEHMVQDLPRALEEWMVRGIKP